VVDTDQGGTFRQLKQVSLGPSVGGFWAQDQVILRVTNNVAVIPPGYNIVTVSFGGPVTLTLPMSASPTTAIGNPGADVMAQVQIQDVSGNASSNTITINAAPGDNIDGLNLITIQSDYGTVILTPDPVLGSWRVSQ